MNAKFLHLMQAPIISAILFAGIFAFAQPALAQAPAPADPAAPAINTAGNDALHFLDDVAGKSGLGKVATTGEDATLNIIGNIINVVLGFVGVIFFILMFWAGFRWMTSAGNEEVVKEAKNTIKTSVIGIAVVFLAFLFTNFVLNQIGIINPPIEDTSQTGKYGLCTYQEDTGAGCDSSESSDVCVFENQCNYPYLSTDVQGVCNKTFEWAYSADCN